MLNGALREMKDRELTTKLENIEFDHDFDKSHFDGVIRMGAEEVWRE